MSNNPHDFNDPTRQGNDYNDPSRQGNDPNDPNRQGQYPPPWNTSQPEENPANHYPPASQYPYPPASYPPPTAEYPPPQAQYPPSTNMAAMHPHVQGPQDPYRLPPPPGAYRPVDVYGQPATQVVYQAAAPRQRTAIACRYCRRRKIRCSGFESSQDGRCSNCTRFNQECMFTPVSSQAQAFVPAHAAYPYLRNGQNQGRSAPVMLYGAHGQPLPPQQQPQAGPDGALPPPQSMYQHPYGGAPQPLAPGSQDHRPIGRRGSGSGFEYPDPTNLAPVTPVTSNPGYSAHTAPSPYYPPPQTDRRPSPQSAYPYDGRHSSSPHGSPYPPMTLPQGTHPVQGTPQGPNPVQGTPPPGPTSTPGSSRGGLNVRDMLNPGDHGRSDADNDMLNALNRRGMNK